MGYGCTTCIGNSRTAAGGSSAGHRRTGSRRSLGAVSGNRNFEGRINPKCGPTIWCRRRWWWRIALAGTRRYRPEERADRPRQRRQAGFPGRHLADAKGSGRGDRAACPPTCSARAMREVYDGDSHWRSLPVPQAMTYAWETGLDLHPRAAVSSTACELEARADRGHQERACARGARRQRHDRPHFSRRLDQEDSPAGKVSDRARRQAGRLQLLRLAARQP